MRAELIKFSEEWIRFVKGPVDPASRDDDRVELAFNSKMTNVHQGSDLEQTVDEMIAHMKTPIENPALLNSRFRFDEALFLDVNFHRLNLMRGSSYLLLPDWLAQKKAIINPQNDDEECFKWAVIAALRWTDIKSHPERISNLREFSNDYNWSGLKFPVSIKDINVFEMNNDISVKVLSVEDKNVYICRKGRKTPQKINLMLISEGPDRRAGQSQGPAGRNNKWHFTSIKSLSRLLTSKNSKHGHKQYFCTNCLQGFTQELSRNQHYSYCIDSKMVRVEMPRKGLTVEFYDGQNQFRAPFMMYVDFEAILELIQERVPGACAPPSGGDPEESYTKKVNQNIPSGWCVYSKFAYGDIDDPLKLYKGKDCVEKFCNHIKQEAHRLYHMFPEKPMDPLTKKQWKRYDKASRCHICFKPFNYKDPKVRDHCHYTGHYRGPAHLLCNLRY